MKLGIMQPYFVPYIGFWQLLNAVDEYVIYDDVNFIKGGWINRNRILVNGNAQYFNIQMKGASSFKLIKDVEVDMSPVWRSKALSTITMAYKKAPYYAAVYPLLERIILCEETCLSAYVANSIQLISDYLGIKTKIWISSELEQDRTLQAEKRVLDICKRMGASEYYNAIGGQDLYSKEVFAEHGLKLSFLKTNPISYPQFRNEFVPNLSIIDVLMFNSPEEIQIMLGDYTLV